MTLYYSSESFAGWPLFWRLVMLFAGALLLVFGSFRACWEVYSWATLAKLEQRPALVGTDPRVYVRAQLVAAALGLTLIVGAVMPW